MLIIFNQSTWCPKPPVAKRWWSYHKECEPWRTSNWALENPGRRLFTIKSGISRRKLRSRRARFYSVTVGHVSSSKFLANSSRLSCSRINLTIPFKQQFHFLTKKRSADFPWIASLCSKLLLIIATTIWYKACYQGSQSCWKSTENLGVLFTSITSLW